MLNKLIFDGTNNFAVVGVEKVEGKILVNVKSTQNGCICPQCKEKSFRIHSYYIRTILYLPMLGNETWIRLRCRKFYCGNDECHKKVFTERFGNHFISGKRMTEKVCEKVSKIAFMLGGKGGEKICHLMHLPKSRSTLIRAIINKQIQSAR